MTVGAVVAALLAPPHAGAAPTPHAVVTTDNETPVLYDDEAGGNASGDDPAIWVHPADSRQSIVIVTAKEGGLRVYDMGSRFVIDPAGAAARIPLTEVTAADQRFLFNPDRPAVDEEHTAYGLAVWQPRPGETYAVVTQEGATTIATVRIVEVGGKLGYTNVQQLAMPSSFRLPDGTTWVPCAEPGVLPQLEGVAVDQASGVLYAAQEDVGLWRLPLPLGPRSRPTLIDRVTDFGVHDVYDSETEECQPVDPNAKGYGGNLLTADVEGVDIYYGRGATGYVLVSSQGDDSFAVYERQGANRARGSFRIKGVGGADDINGSDGLAVTNRPVGDYRQGLLVTHDEPETGPDVDDERDATNFSYVSWGDIADAMSLTVDTRAGNDPRLR
ncbi:phytase [Micromonospora zingiberis]|uniref:Phytase n=2 Tax=Micromonospora zingiberis TaxID=2053011 RepID=A0A4R0G1Y0_9ACTN|nr:phytase [Micromonospora zingiberis]